MQAEECVHHSCCASVQLAFSEAAESNAGPFTVHAHMRSLDDGTLFPHGTGKVAARLRMPCAPCLAGRRSAVPAPHVAQHKHAVRPKKPR